MTLRLCTLLLCALMIPTRSLNADDSVLHPPGRMVDIGGYKLHLHCTGQGSPTVIFENGLGDIFSDWALVQPEVSKFTQACSYDHAYEGFSDAGPIPVTMHQQAYELHLLLRASKINTPVILVGHSYGGLLAKLYAMTYPEDVAGLIFVDSLHEDTVMGDKPFRLRAEGKAVPPPQTMQSSPPLPYTAEEQKLVDRAHARAVESANQPPDPVLSHLPASSLAYRRWAKIHEKFPSTAKGMQETWLPEEMEAIHDSRQKGPAHPLKEVPIVVIGTERDNPGSPEERRRQLDDMAALSTNSKLEIDTKSGHHVQWEDPSFVVDAVKQVTQSARTHSQLAK